MRAEKLAHDGAAEGVFEGKPVRVFGMLAGEEGIVEAYKKRGIWIGTLKELTHASPSRKDPEEPHYLSCSPWQVMEYSLQLKEKQAVLESLFGFYADAPRPSFVTASQLFGYRTKIEFSFTDRLPAARLQNERGQATSAAQAGDGEKAFPLSLAFHVRGG